MSLPPLQSKAAAVRDGTVPRPLADRLRLLAILLILPVLAVTVPTLVVTHFFGQRPKPKQSAAKRTPDANPLRSSLEKSAATLFPTPSSLSPDPITVTVRAEHLAARMDKIVKQAARFGGSASEGLSTATEKHLSIEVPASSADAFRQTVSSNAALDAPVPSPSAGKDYVEVIVRAAAEDE